MSTHAPESWRAPYLARAEVRTALVLGLLVLEVFLGQSAAEHSPGDSPVATFWPNAGISVIALALTAPRWRGGVLAGIGGVSLLANHLGGRSFDIALCLALVNVAEAAFVTWWLLRGRRPRPQLHKLEDFGRLVAAALMGSLLGGFLVGATAATLGDADLLFTWRAVATSHAAAIVVLAPLGMSLPRHHRRLAQPAEAGLVWALLVTTTAALFINDHALPLAFLPFPFLVWGAARLSTREVTVQLAAFGGLTAALTMAGHGPFVAAVELGGHPQELIGTLLQGNLLAAALVALPLTLVRAQQRTSLDRLTRGDQVVNNILAATTGNAILGTTLDGRIEFFNVGAELMSGYRTDEVVGKASVALVEGEDGAVRLRIALGEEPDPTQLRTLIEGFLQSPHPSVTTDWEFVRRDGELRTISLAVSRRYGDDGAPMGYLGVADDVTERRRHEAMVEAALESEKQIVERLAQLDQTKNDFLASVSHELRTPITSIIGYSELLLSDDTGTLPAMHHQVVGRIERNGRRLMGLIEDMLTMSQVEVGNLPFHRVPLDLRQPVLNALEAAQPALGLHGLELDQELGDEAVEVLGDADKLERVFANLMSNATKFSHRGGTVVVRLTVEGDHALFTVTDSGLGISQEDQAHLFDRFYRGADAHALAIQGVGLGLSIASSIVAGHDGRIDVASELGQGSTFLVRLPLLRAERCTDNGAETDPGVGQETVRHPV